MHDCQACYGASSFITHEYMSGNLSTFPYAFDERAIMASPARLALRLAIVTLFTVGLAVGCSESPVGLEESASFEELERGLESSGHRQCLELTTDLRSRFSSIPVGQLFGEILQVARDCVAGGNTATIMVVTTTTGEGTDLDGYRIEEPPGVLYRIGR